MFIIEKFNIRKAIVGAKLLQAKAEVKLQAKLLLAKLLQAKRMLAKLLQAKRMLAKGAASKAT